MNSQVGLFVTIVIVTWYPASTQTPITEWSGNRNSLTKCVCGRDSQKQGRSDLGSRIVGGVVMEEKTHQFLAAIWNKSRFACGGSVVSPYHILTAAHCTVNNTEADMKVYLGLRKREHIEQFEMFPVIEIIRHSGYKAITDGFVVNDIALLRVDRIHFKDIIQPICIPFNNEVGHAVIGSVAGWGVTKYDGEASLLPRIANLRVMSPEECLNTPWGQAMWNIPDIEKMVVCAYSPGTDACQGDSGGPLYATNSLGTNFQIGIVSFGDECANTKGIPGIYTNLVYYRDWLREKLRGQECSPF